MVNIPEPPDTEMKPIFRIHVVGDTDSLPAPNKVPVPDLPASIAPKTAMPAKDSLIWEGVRHFIFGALSGGSAAWLAIAGVLKSLGVTGVAALGLSVSNPFGYIILGCALLLGTIESVRKIEKDKNGRDWTEKLYDLIVLIVTLLTAMVAKKKVSK